MKESTLLQEIYASFASLLLLIFYLSEGFSKYSIVFQGDKLDAPRFIKLIVTVLFCIILTRKSLWSLNYLGFLTISFVLGQLFLDSQFNTEIVVSFSKYLFPILLFLYFKHFPLNTKQRHAFLTIFEGLILLNSLLVITGFLFDISWFSSYSTRFGYNGLFITSATGSYVYILALFYFLVRRKHFFFKDWKPIVILLTCLLIGTKAVYLGMLVALATYLLYYTNRFKRYKREFLLTIAILSVGIFYIVFFQWGIFNELRQKEGFLSSVLSLRNDLFVEKSLPFIQDKWSWGNYLFGGIANMETRSQMGIIDVFFFWGIIGGVLYLWSFYKTFAAFQLTKDVKFLLLGLTTVVFLAGNFFENASVAIYLLVFKEAILNSQKSLERFPAHE